MYQVYETERLVLKVIDGSFAELVLDYFNTTLQVIKFKLPKNTTNQTT